MVKVNGVPLELIPSETLRFKAFEPLMILGKERFSNINMRIRVRGGGMTAQIYGKSFFPKKNGRKKSA